ncbi:MAG: dihydropteroate synthase [Clostridiales Family XIII bacterium]|jgi:5-methyltetrahydrofolate corrinoid/iron sulfur protein methyltransferase|nr:dihydropteroate synthase [Clostridiales Family XIII bacterium]
MDKFIVIGERIHVISPEIKEAIGTRNPAAIIARGKVQLEAGADYLDVNIGPAERDGVEIMKWIVPELQRALDNAPLVLDTVNQDAIRAGLEAYNPAKGRAVVNSADAGERISNLDLAAEFGAISIGLLMKKGVPASNDERNEYLQTILEHAMEAGMDPAEDVWFDPLTLVIKGMQEKQEEFLEFIRVLKEMGLKSTCGLSNASNGMPKHVRPVVDSVLCAMSIECGLTSAIMNPTDKALMDTVKTSEIVLNRTLYADSFLDI